jgi:hypothetical protein
MSKNLVIYVNYGLLAKFVDRGLCSRDLTAERVVVSGSGGPRKAILGSAYLPRDSSASCI